MKSLYMKITMFLVTFIVPALAFAEEAAMGGLSDAYKAASAAIGAGIGIGLAAAGGAIGQGNAVASAVEGIARNPGSSDKIFTPMIIGLALIESLVIYALLIAFMLYGKV